MPMSSPIVVRPISATLRIHVRVLPVPYPGIACRKGAADSCRVAVSPLPTNYYKMINAGIGK